MRAVDWDSATWGSNPIHESSWAPDRHDATEAVQA